MADEERSGDLKKALTKAGEKYCGRTSLRAAVQAIPYVGGPLDTLLSGHAGKIQEERFRSFLGELDARLRRIENLAGVEGDEQFFDLMLDVFDRAIRVRSKEKRARFAQIVVNQVRGSRDWNNAEEAVRILAGLSDLHIEVLREALAAQPCGPPFEGLRVVSLASKDLETESANKPLNLVAALPCYPHLALRMACSELAARGLLHDEGIGRWNLSALQYLIPTELASWFMEQLTSDA